ncbi:hypothetical protein BT63DRAFT_410694 [Microthyrium microscopicum]|uniref:DUF974 domain protein n=1 Tax=Microthyrium microscopicum TaxID=703497 RepID=A0A6A6UN78_9PEZI|nr:hypothetical protein BT63DRAFT_410694 [Microthyrium microscopicum]
MARARGQSIGEGLKTPHTVSLKVLRLTRPSLAQQFPLPKANSDSVYDFSPSAGLAYPHSTPLATNFLLTPLLTLPESFQSAYVGEVFSCTLSANNELPADDTARSISGVRIAAEIVSPSNPSGVALDLEEPVTPASSSFAPGASLQRILRLNLQEEGDHTLAVTVTYTETAVGTEGRAAGGRVRTFRKLYQFIATNLISVRTKAGDVDGGRYALEAQLENLGERAVTMEAVRMNPKSPFTSHSLNWDMPGATQTDAPVLQPGDIMQVAFLLEELQGEDTGQEVPASSPAADKRFILGQLNVQWRSAMGDRGSISTGWLTGKKR